MKKLSVALSVLLILIFACTTIWAAEYKYAGPPAFTVTYPDKSQPDKKTSAEQVWAVKIPSGVSVQAGVGPVPAGVELKDYAEKTYKPGLAAAQKTSVTVKKNEPFKTEDGTPAYYSELEWKFQGSTLITTVMVAAYKDGKVVTVTGHPWADIDEPKEIAESLKFVK